MKEDDDAPILALSATESTLDEKKRIPLNLFGINLSNKLHSPDPLFREMI